MISLNMNCILQLKQFYNKATKVSCRKKCYYFWWSTWLLSMTGEYPMHPATANLCHGYLEKRETAQPMPTTTTTTITTTSTTTAAADTTSTATTTTTTTITTTTTTTTITTTSTTTCIFLVCRVAWPLFQWELRYGEFFKVFEYSCYSVASFSSFWWFSMNISCFSTVLKLPLGMAGQAATTYSWVLLLFGIRCTLGFCMHFCSYF